MIDIKIIRTNAVSGKITIEDAHYEIYKTQQGGEVFQLYGGSTGYESFYVKDPPQWDRHIVGEDTTLEAMAKRGWCACMGTPNRWDKVEVSAEEMTKVLSKYKKGIKT